MKSLFFIVASPRSGTTLLERLLNRHSEIFIPPETAFFFLMKKNGYLNKTFNRSTAEKAVNFYLTRKPAKLLKLNEIENIKEKLLLDANSFSDVFTNLYGLLENGTECSVFGEKTPHHLDCIDYISEQFNKPYIIALIRDGRAVAKSHVKHPNWGGNILAAAEAWKRDALLLKKCLTEFDKRKIHLVTYEKLLENPEVELKRICEFLSLTFQKSMLEDSKNIPENFKEYYQQDWMAKSTNSIDTTRIYSWKTEYRQNELALVEHVIGSELQIFGYEVESDSGTGWGSLWFKEKLRDIWFRLHRWVINKYTTLFNTR